MVRPRPLLPALGRGLRMLARPATPLLVQMVVTRRCNLSCGYCYEYDDSSPPVPTPTLIEQVDHVARLGTVILTLTGGEPLLHPELDRIVAHSVGRGMITTSITNAYALTESWVERLNRAGLTALQVSIDNLEPNPVSQKSWRKVKEKLRLLRGRARFAVNVNAVLGSSDERETLEVVREVEEMGFYMSVGLMHDERGQIDRGLLGADLDRLYRELSARSRKSIYHLSGLGWQEQLLSQGTAPWKCRAGGRYLYVDEAGLVSYCSQRRGDPGIRLLDYGPAELERAFDLPKGCEPTCTIGCVRQASAFDQWRTQAGS